MFDKVQDSLKCSAAQVKLLWISCEIRFQANSTKILEIGLIYTMPDSAFLSKHTGPFQDYHSFIDS